MDFIEDLFIMNRYEEKKADHIVIGIVKENWDESNKGRVKVELFSGEEGRTETVWIRVASMYTANLAGLYFLPEIGTEVLVAFIGGNQNEPVVIGSLWNEQHTQSLEQTVEENTIKAIRTKAGNEIILNDTKEKSEIAIRTVGKLKLSLSDESKHIHISDEEGSSSIEADFEKGTITLSAEKEIHLSIGSSDFITIDDKNITLKADNITLEAGQGLKMKGQSLGMQGNSVSIKSDASLKVSAEASLKLEGNAMTEVKGGMVKIN